MKPKNCPKCKTIGDNINNAEDMCDLFGLDASERKNKRWVCSKCDYFFDEEKEQITQTENNNQVIEVLGKVLWGAPSKTLIK